MNHFRFFDAHAYYDTTRISIDDYLNFSNKYNFSKFIISPSWTNDFEPDKNKFAYFMQRQMLKTKSLRFVASKLTKSFYNKNNELNPFWRIFTKGRKPINKVVNPERGNVDLEKQIIGYKEIFKMWYWVNPNILNDFNKINEKILKNYVAGIKFHAYGHNLKIESISKFIESVVCKKTIYIILGYDNLSQIEILLKKFSSNKFIFGYGGFPYFMDAWKIFKKYDNTYIDFSSYHIDKSLIKKAILMLGTSKCIFGSDCPYNFKDNGKFSYEKTFERIKFEFLKTSDYENIFYNNLERIINTI